MASGEGWVCALAHMLRNEGEGDRFRHRDLATDAPMIWVKKLSNHKYLRFIETDTERRLVISLVAAKVVRPDKINTARARPSP